MLIADDQTFCTGYPAGCRYCTYVDLLVESTSVEYSYSTLNTTFELISVRTLIKSELDALKASVSSDADNCMELLSKMMAECRGMYDAAFRTSINEVVGGDPTAYTNMLRQCAELRSSYRSRCIKEQPSSELIPLVLMAKESIPSFKRAVESVIARAHAVLAEQGRTSGTTLLSHIG